MVENGSEGFKYDGFEDFGGLNGYLFEDVVDSSSVEDPVVINDKNDILEVDLANIDCVVVERLNFVDLES